MNEAYPGELKWHPFAYHSLDITAVEATWWHSSSAIRRIFLVDEVLLGLLELPAHAFGRALVPRSVYDECLAEARHGDAELIRIAAESGFILVSADLPWPASILIPRLDGGELAALALALAQSAPVLISGQART